MTEFLLLKPGDEHPEVQVLQIALTTHGFFRGPITKCFNAGTEKALQDFQHFRGLHSTGEADETTWKHLSMSHEKYRLSKKKHSAV